MFSLYEQFFIKTVVIDAILQYNYKPVDSTYFSPNTLFVIFH